MIATARELFEARHYPGVVAMCGDALEAEPGCIPLILIRAQAHIALRRELDAQADLREIIRLDPQRGAAYRLLGELAARRNEHDSAKIFFREALRLDPDDREAADWLALVEPATRSAAAGRSFAGGSGAPAPRFATGTSAPDPGDDRPTRPFARGSQPEHHEGWKTPVPVIQPRPTPVPVSLQPTELAAEAPRPRPTVPLPASAARPPAATPAVRSFQHPCPRAPVVELPGFGDHLVTSGILTRERLRAAQAYQRSMKVQLSTAIVTLGLASAQRIEMAAVAYQAQLARDRQQP